MTPGTYDLTIARDCAFGPLRITCEDAAGQPVNLTGYTAAAEVRAKPGAPLIVQLGPTVTNGPAGQLTLALSDATTADLDEGHFRWDLILIQPDGTRLAPILAGPCTIVRTITA